MPQTPDTSHLVSNPVCSICGPHDEYVEKSALPGLPGQCSDPQANLISPVLAKIPNSSGLTPASIMASVFNCPYSHRWLCSRPLAFSSCLQPGSWFRRVKTQLKKEGWVSLFLLHLSWRLTREKTPKGRMHPHSFTTSILTGHLVPS